MYIELKSGFSDDGPAWISKVELSKSGQTVFFNNTALKRLKKPGIGANHFDIETGEEYWISGIKKNGQDRHWAGSGQVMIDKDIIDEYLKYTGQIELDLKKFQMIDINKEFDKTRFGEIENRITEIPDYNQLKFYQWSWDNNHKKLIKE